MKELLKKNSKRFFNNSFNKLFVQSPPKASAGSLVTHFKQNRFQTFRKFRLSEYEVLVMLFPSEHPTFYNVIQSEAKDLGNIH